MLMPIIDDEYSY